MRGAKAISGIVSIKQLFLDDTQIGDVGLESLTKLPRLEKTQHSKIQNDRQRRGSITQNACTRSWEAWGRKSRTRATIGFDGAIGMD